jgi:hypothetical protein
MWCNYLESLRRAVQCKCQQMNARLAGESVFMRITYAVLCLQHQSYIRGLTNNKCIAELMQQLLEKTQPTCGTISAWTDCGSETILHCAYVQRCSQPDRLA